MTTLLDAPPPPARRRALRAALLAGVAAVVLGIFGMHALTLHATDVSHSLATAAGSHTDAAVTPGDAHPSPASGSGHGGDGQGHNGQGHDMGGMIMLCIAMLAAGAAAFVALRAARLDPGRPWAVLAARTDLRVAGRLLPTGSGPPPAWRYSVIRC